MLLQTLPTTVQSARPHADKAAPRSPHPAGRPRQSLRNTQTQTQTHTHTHTHTDTHGHTDTRTHTDTHTHRQTHRHTHRHTDTQTHIHTNLFIDVKVAAAILRLHSILFVKARVPWYWCIPSRALSAPNQQARAMSASMHAQGQRACKACRIKSNHNAPLRRQASHL